MDDEAKGSAGTRHNKGRDQHPRSCGQTSDPVSLSPFYGALGAHFLLALGFSEARKRTLKMDTEGHSAIHTDA